MAKTLQRSEKRKRLPSRDKTDAIVTSMALPRTLHQRAMIAGVRLNWSFAEVVRAALTEWLDRVASERSSRGRS